MNGSIDFGGHSFSGGYLPSTGAQESPSTPKVKGARKSQNLGSITIADFYELMKNSETVKIGEKEIGLLCFVGIVRKVDVQSTIHIYEIDDMTGPCLVVKRWLDESGADNEPPQLALMENTYVKVIGVARKVQGQVFLLGIHLKPVTDLNQLTQHILEAMHSKLILMQDNKGADGNSSTNSFGGVDHKPSQDGSIGITPGLPPHHAMLLKLISGNTHEHGLSRDFLQQATKLPLDVLCEALTKLSDEGHIYSTYDDDHYKSTYEN